MANRELAQALFVTPKAAANQFVTPLRSTPAYATKIARAQIAR